MGPASRARNLETRGPRRARRQLARAAAPSARRSWRGPRRVAPPRRHQPNQHNWLHQCRQLWPVPISIIVSRHLHEPPIGISRTNSDCLGTCEPVLKIRHTQLAAAFRRQTFRGLFGRPHARAARATTNQPMGNKLVGRVLARAGLLRYPLIGWLRSLDCAKLISNGSGEPLPVA